MVTRSKKWTPHHTHLGYHTLTFVVSVMLVAFFSWMLGIALASVSAQQPTDVAVNQPTQSDTAETNVGIEPEQPIGEDSTITVVPGDSIQQRYVFKDGEVQPIFIFGSQFPKFIGVTNIQDSYAVLDIFGPTHVTGKARVDSNGNWAWESTVPVLPGTYIFSVKAVHSQSSIALAKDSLLFEVVLDKDQQVAILEMKNIPQLGNKGTLFDVQAIIPESSKYIEAGTDVNANIKFINFGPAGKSVDVEVQYVITDEFDEVVSKSSETMAISKELAFSKSFYTASDLPSGVYNLTVTVPSRDLIATASDSFEIGSESEVANATSNNKKTPFSGNPIIWELLGAMLFLGIIIAYMEYNKVRMLSRTIRQINDGHLLGRTRAAHH